MTGVPAGVVAGSFTAVGVTVTWTVPVYDAPELSVAV